MISKEEEFDAKVVKLMKMASDSDGASRWTKGQIYYGLREICKGVTKDEVSAALKRLVDHGAVKTSVKVVGKRLQKSFRWNSKTISKYPMSSEGDFRDVVFAKIEKLTGRIRELEGENAHIKSAMDEMQEQINAVELAFISAHPNEEEDVEQSGI
jgi:seryl-tRNA synthetase